MTTKLLAFALLSSLAMTACSSSSSSGSKSSGDDNGYEKAANVRCTNPISVDNNGASDVIRTTHGRYALKSMQIYSVNSAGDSIAATASSYRNFSVSIDCNGVSDGTDMNVDLTSNTVIDLDSSSGNGESRDLSLEIQSGQVTNATAKIFSSDSSGAGTLSDIPKGRFQTGDGYMTLNANMLSMTTLEIKLKLENSSGSGKLAEYGRFVFERQY